MALKGNSGASRGGRGLSGLLARLNIGAGSRDDEVVPVSEICPDPNQPRKNFSEAELSELAESIKQHGLLQPLIVTPLTGEGAKYRIVAGERRFQAGKAAGLREVPVKIVRGDPKTLFQIQLVENLQREDLTLIETATALRDLIERHGLTQGELAAGIGWNRAAVSNKIRILSLPKEVIRLLAEGKLTEGHAKVLLSLDSGEKVVELARDCVKNGWSVKALSSHVIRASRKTTVLFSTRYKAWRPKGAAKLSQRLGIKIGASSNGKTNRVVLHGLTKEQVERLLGILEESADALSPADGAKKS